MILNPVLLFYESPQFDRPQEDIPQPVPGLIKADSLSRAGRRYAHPSIVPPDPAVPAHQPRLEMPRVDQIRHHRRHRYLRGAIEFGRRPQVYPFVWPDLIILLPKYVKQFLLLPHIGPGRSGRLRFQYSVHILVLPVLLRLARLDQFRSDPKSEPPYRKLRKPCQRCRCERRPVIRSDRCRQSILSKQLPEDRPHSLFPGRSQPLASQQISRIPIRHRQRIAVSPVSCPELSLEVHAPQLVRRPHYCRRLPGCQR